MQEEKDHRVYGAEDGAIRGNMFRQVQERWLEWQKLFLSIIPLPEISAARRSYSANRTPTSATCLRAIWAPGRRGAGSSTGRPPGAGPGGGPG
jgi:Methane/Phenol/Toluene Hydroxylase